MKAILDQHDHIAARAARTSALIKKETRQILRDPGSITVGMILPVVLILLFGFGLSLDVKHVPVAVVLEDASPDAVELASVFELSSYFHCRMVPSMELGRELILERQVDGIIRIRSGLRAPHAQRRCSGASGGSWRRR